MTYHLGQNWRGWLTGQFRDAWLDGKSYLHLQHNKKYSQNPDQRISETTQNVATSTLSLGLGLFRSVLNVATFSVVLWSLSPMMLAGAVGFSALFHVASIKAGGPMRGVWKKLMDTEAKFRHALGRVRDNAKPIALAGLESVEKETLTEEFNALDRKRRDFFKLNLRVSMVSSLNLSSASVVPVGMMAPQFFAGTATLGGLELARQAYGHFYQAISWFPQGFTQIASWSAQVSQLMEFKKDLDDNKLDITVPKPTAVAKPAFIARLAGAKL
jgi:putative ATP-binding cassette transporter